jgi:hypothetical protein
LKLAHFPSIYHRVSQIPRSLDQRQFANSEDALGEHDNGDGDGLWLNLKIPELNGDPKLFESRCSMELFSGLNGDRFAGGMKLNGGAKR